MCVEQMFMDTVCPQLFQLDIFLGGPGENYFMEPATLPNPAKPEIVTMLQKAFNESVGACPNCGKFRWEYAVVNESDRMG
ncbi:MAG: hypothetical protein WA821_11645 [Anaerolineales bacterium]